MFSRDSGDRWQAALSLLGLFAPVIVYLVLVAMR